MTVITVERRNPEAKAKKLRKSGFVPGNIFGGSLAECLLIQLDESTARKLVREKREGSRLNLKLDEKNIPVQIKEKCIDVVSGEIRHLSFQALKSDQKVNSVIHILLKNTEKILSMLNTQRLEIPYAALPEDMIDTITLDLDNMKEGDTLTIAEIPELVSDKIELQVAREEIVLQIGNKRHSVAPETEQAAE